MWSKRYRACSFFVFISAPVNAWKVYTPDASSPEALRDAAKKRGLKNISRVVAGNRKISAFRSSNKVKEVIGVGHAEVPGMDREQRLRQWVETYSDAILRVCFLYLSDRAQAQDALQDTLIKAWKHMGNIERMGIQNEKAWLMKIAINTCKDYRRTSWFRHVDRSRALEDLPPQMMCVEPEDRAITGAVMELPDKYKQVVLLYYFQGLTQRETAQALGLTPSAVVRRLRAAEARLRQALMGGEADEE